MSIEVAAQAGLRVLAVTQRARYALARVCRERGPQSVVVSWPGGATYLPAELFAPGAFDVIVGHIAGCPMYADIRQIALYRHRAALLDVAGGLRHRRPVLRLSPYDASADQRTGQLGETQP